MRKARRLLGGLQCRSQKTLWNTAKRESSKEQCKNNTAQKKRSKEVNRPPQCLASLIVLMKHCTPEEAAKELSCKYINN